MGNTRSKIPKAGEDTSPGPQCFCPRIKCCGGETGSEDEKEGLKNDKQADKGCCANYTCSTFFSCGGCFNKVKATGKTRFFCDSMTRILRSVVTLLIAVVSLLTLMQFGQMMDDSHFPGAGIRLAKYENGLKNGTLIDDMRDGYVLEDPVDFGSDNANASECSNFITPSDLPTTHKQLCQGTTNETQVWTSGWVSAYKCAKTIDITDCPGWSGMISMLGMVDFYLVGVSIVLFALSTWISINDGLFLSEKKTWTERFIWWFSCSSMEDGERNIILLTLLWAGAGGFFAFSAAGSWVTMCDKIDTGLGRIIEYSLSNSSVVGAEAPACFTQNCEASFSSLFMWYAFAVVWLFVPDIFMFYFPMVVPVEESKSKL